jgi:hypothetical protein
VKKALNLFDTPVGVDASITVDPTKFDSKALFENARQAKEKAKAEIDNKGMGALVGLADGMAALNVGYLDVFPNNSVSIAKVRGAVIAHGDCAEERQEPPTPHIRVAQELTS